jgi:hypothetical protein
MYPTKIWHILRASDVQTCSKIFLESTRAHRINAKLAGHKARKRPVRAWLSKHCDQNDHKAKMWESLTKKCHRNSCLRFSVFRLNVSKSKTNFLISTQTSRRITSMLRGRLACQLPADSGTLTGTSASQQLSSRFLAEACQISVSWHAAGFLS